MSSSRYLGRGHTDNDIVVTIPDADVLCAGDLLENGAPPWFGDGYPMDWPATAEALLELGERTVVVPGHGDAGDAGVRGVARSREIRAIADAGAARPAGELDLDAAVAAAPYPPGRGARAPRAGAGPAPRRARPALAARRLTTARDAHDPAAAGLAVDDRVERRLERRRASTSVIAVLDAARPQVRRRGAPTAPGAASIGMLARVHPQQRDAAQDEREHRRARAPRRPRSREDATAAPVAERPQHVGQRRRADRVHGARPARRVERPAGRAYLVAGQEPRRAEVAQPVVLVGLAGRRPHLVTASGEDRDGGRCRRRPTRRSPAPARRRAAGRAPRAPRRSSPP